MSKALLNFFLQKSRFSLYLLRRRAKQTAAKSGVGRAVDDLGRIVAFGGARPSDHTRYALALQESGRIDDGIQALRRASRLYPTTANIHRQFALALLRPGRNLEARLAFVRAFLLKPDDPVLIDDLKGLGAIPLSLAESIRAFDFAEQPHSGATAPPRKAALSRARKAFARKDWSEAARLYRKVTAAHPRFANGHLQLGHALKEEGRLAEAETSYWHAMAALPRSPEILLQIGHLHKVRGKPDFLDAGLAAWRLQPGNVAVLAELQGQGLDYRTLMTMAATSGAGLPLAASAADQSSFIRSATPPSVVSLPLGPPESFGFAERALWSDLSRALMQRD